jgi:hypothetical protein
MWSQKPRAPRSYDGAVSVVEKREEGFHNSARGSAAMTQPWPLTRFPGRPLGVVAGERKGFSEAQSVARGGPPHRCAGGRAALTTRKRGALGRLPGSIAVLRPREFG